MEPCSPLRWHGTPLFGPCLLWPTVAHLSYCWALVKIMSVIDENEYALFGVFNGFASSFNCFEDRTGAQIYECKNWVTWLWQCPLWGVSHPYRLKLAMITLAPLVQKISMNLVYIMPRGVNLNIIHILLTNTWSSHSCRNSLEVGSWTMTYLNGCRLSGQCIVRVAPSVGAPGYWPHTA